MAQNRRTYPGIYNDHFGGMTEAGRVIRDAWVFGLLAEDETCEGWDHARLESLYRQVSEAWDPYGHLASNLPDDLRERHARIHGEALKRAKEHGWSPNMVDDD